MTHPSAPPSWVAQVTSRLRGEPGQLTLLAWSGGLDSTALFELAARAGIPLIAVHVDHQLRESSRHDASFCARQASARGIPLHLERLVVQGAGSLQERARVQRYAALARAASRHGAQRVLTAHHADDALETALLNQARGASLRGLTSLAKLTAPAPIPSWPADLHLIRPLFDVPRDALARWAHQQSLRWIEDPTNDQRVYRRNLVRHDLLPRLTDAGRHAQAWRHGLRQLADQYATLDHEVERITTSALLTPLDAETTLCASAPLARAPRPSRVLALQRLAELAGARLRRVHLDQLAEVLEAGGTTRLAIPRGLLTLASGLLIIERARGRGARHLADRHMPPVRLDLGRQRELAWGRTQIRLERTDRDASARPASPPLWARGGARRTPRGVLIPEPLRWRWPVLCREDRRIVLGARRICLGRVGLPNWTAQWLTGDRSCWNLLCDAPPPSSAK